jgi:hypothetical protein
MPKALTKKRVSYKKAKTLSLPKRRPSYISRKNKRKRVEMVRKRTAVKKKKPSLLDDISNFTSKTLTSQAKKEADKRMEIIGSLKRGEMLLYNVNYYSLFSFSGFTVYIFGEQHAGVKTYGNVLKRRKKLDGKITDFIEDFADALGGKECLDIFLEFGPNSHTQSFYSENAIQNIISSFSNNKLPRKGGRDVSKYSNNYRLHEVDYRNEPVAPEKNKNNPANWKQLGLGRGDDIAVLVGFIRDLLIGEREKITEMLLSDFKISHIQISKLIKSFSKSIFNNTAEFFNVFASCINTDMESTEHMMNFVRDRKYVFLLQLFMMDVYTVSRMFPREYVVKTDKTRAGLIASCVSDVPKNIIFHGGSSHSKFYTRFIRAFFGEAVVAEEYSKPHVNMLKVIKSW